MARDLDPFAAISRDGRLAIQLHQVGGGDETCLLVTGKLEPGGPDRLFEIGYPRWSIQRGGFPLNSNGFPSNTEPRLRNLLSLAVGEALDDLDSLPEPPDTDAKVERIELGDVTEAWEKADGRQRASVEEGMLYFGAKIYWSWFFGLASAKLERTDEYRLGIPEGDGDRLALAGADAYWTLRTDTVNYSVYEPTGKLIREFRAGVFPGLSSTPVSQVQRQLAAPRYNSPRVAFQKATEFLAGDHRDLENAAKEAAVAAESLGKIVLDLPDRATLDDVKDRVRQDDKLDPPLHKAFEALWGFRSDQSGVGHGKKRPPEVEVAEAKFALNMAASIALLLLELDTP